MGVVTFHGNKVKNSILDVFYLRYISSSYRCGVKRDMCWAYVLGSSLYLEGV